MKISQPVTMPVPSEGTEFPELPAPSGHDPARIIAICNQKGGVRRTTTAINLPTALAGYDRRVLLVDFDPRGAASVGLGIDDHELDNMIRSLIFSGHRSVAIRDMIQNTGIENLDLIPANINLSAAELQLVNEVMREATPVRVLHDIEQDYDLIVTGCRPSLDLLTTNALTAARGVIIPMVTKFFVPYGVALLMETANTVHDRLSPRLQLGGILATMVDSRTLCSKEVLKRLTEALQDKMFPTVINRTVKFPGSTVTTRPITEFVSTHDGAEAYHRLAREVIAKGYVT